MNNGVKPKKLPNTPFDAQFLYLPTHPVPMEAKAEAVHLLPHGPDITEQRRQNSNIWVCINDER